MFSTTQESKYNFASISVSIPYILLYVFTPEIYGDALGSQAHYNVAMQCKPMVTTSPLPGMTDGFRGCNGNRQHTHTRCLESTCNVRSHYGLYIKYIPLATLVVKRHIFFPPAMITRNLCANSQMYKVAPPQHLRDFQRECNHIYRRHVQIRQSHRTEW